jgi:hypothetical protein
LKTINIIYVNNGVGLTKDASILREILVKAGYYVFLVEPRLAHTFKTADIAIHLEIIQSNFFRLGRKNIYFPNPEWYQFGWDKFLHQYDVVCAKTLDCERIFNNKHRNVVYTNFTSIDRFSEMEKIKSYLHTGGQSETKATDKIYHAWRLGFGKLLLCSKKYNFKSTSNILYRNWLLEKDHIYAQNKCLIHLCPSIYEGFGHIINEARSCGAVIVTTDAEPMKEFVSGNGFLIPVAKTGTMALAKTYHVDHLGIAETIEQIEKIDYNILLKMGEISRKLYLNDKEIFEHRFLQIIKEL